MILQEFLDNKYTKTKQLALTELRCASSNLTSLDGIENLINLETFDCSYNKISSIEGIENLVNLTYLDCSHNELTSLKGIEKLSKLELISYSDNKLKYKSNEFEDIINDIFKEIKIENRKNTISKLLNTNQ